MNIRKAFLPTVLVAALTAGCGGPNCHIYRGPVMGGLSFENPETGQVDTVQTYPVGEGSPLQDLRMGNTYDTRAISESGIRWVQECTPDSS